jgi:hypothetical protein
MCIASKFCRFVTALASGLCGFMLVTSVYDSLYVCSM